MESRIPECIWYHLTWSQNTNKTRNFSRHTLHACYCSIRIEPKLHVHCICSLALSSEAWDPRSLNWKAGSEVRLAIVPLKGKGYHKIVLFLYLNIHPISRAMNGQKNVAIKPWLYNTVILTKHNQKSQWELPEKPEAIYRQASKYFHETLSVYCTCIMLLYHTHTHIHSLLVRSEQCTVYV